MNHQAARDAAANLAYPVDGKGGDWKATHPAVYIAPPSPQPRWTVVQCAEMLDVEVSTAEDWHTEAECRGFATRMFFPERGEPGSAAMVCDTCTVRAECLAHALNAGEATGIWGGMQERQRRNLRNGRPFIIRTVSGPKRMPPATVPSKRAMPIRHGTAPGFQQHLRRDEDPCQACRDAYNKHAYQRRKNRQ